MGKQKSIHIKWVHLWLNYLSSPTKILKDNIGGTWWSLITRVFFTPQRRKLHTKPTNLVHKPCKIWRPHNQHKESIAITSNNFLVSKDAHKLFLCMKILIRQNNLKRWNNWHVFKLWLIEFFICGLESHMGYRFCTEEAIFINGI